jgi:hypothetical protein
VAVGNGNGVAKLVTPSEPLSVCCSEVTRPESVVPAPLVPIGRYGDTVPASSITARKLSRKAIPPASVCSASARCVGSAS